jgi:cytochrome c556
MTGWAMLCAVASVAPLRAGQAAKISVETHEGYMKTLTSTNQSLGTKMMSNDLAGGAKDAQQIATIFADIEKFWAQYNKSDAVKWSQEGRQNALEVAAALSAGDATKAQTARKTMSASCGSCHMTYREGGPQSGGYTLKAGVATP